MLKNTVKYLFFYILISCFLYAGNTGKISGYIHNLETGEPLPGINILVSGTDLGAASDFEGYFVILFVPPGNFELVAQGIGYADSRILEVDVKADLTTNISFKMKTSVVEGESVTVTADKPLVQVDQISSRNTITSDVFDELPLEDIGDILDLTAGFVDGHARGGRSGEILYMINGVPAMDPMHNSFDTDIPEYAIASTDIITSGMSAEYSNALSGVVNMVTQEGPDELTARFRVRTDNNEFLNMGFPTLRQSQSIEGSIGGPVMGLPIRWFLAGEWSESNGRYGIANEKSSTVSGTFTWRPMQKTKVKLSFNLHDKSYNDYSHRYSRTTYENEDSDGDNRLDRVITLTSLDLLDETFYLENEFLYGLNQEEVLQVHDINSENPIKRNILIEFDVDENGNALSGDGDFRHEDLNGNGIWEITDLNQSGIQTDSSFIDINNDEKFQFGSDIAIPNVSYSDTLLEGMSYNIFNANRNLTNNQSDIGFNDSFNMLEHLLRNDANSSHITLSVNQQFAKNSFLQVFLSRYNTYYSYNTEESSDITPYIDFLSDAGIEGEHIEKYSNDLFTDYNNNDFLDISEDAFPEDESKWLAWESIPVQNTQDIDKFYTYGSGTTFYRNRWNVDEKTIWNFKTIFTSQFTKHHLIKGGFELNTYDVFDHDVDMPSGGNIYGQDIGSMNGWGRTEERFLDYGLDGLANTSDTGENDGDWDHIDWGEDGMWAVDGNNDGDFDDDFIDIPEDNGENDGKVNYDEPHEFWYDTYPDQTWNAPQGRLNPLWWGIFLEDKMEFEGLVFVAGLRMDYFDPRFDNYPSNLNDPVVDQTQGGQVKDPVSVDPKYYWSPRIGIAYPITDRDALYFNYGRTFQVPQFQYMYRNINWDFSGAFPIVGNPNIMPETTTSYELGLRHQIGDFWRLELKGFYKDIQGLVNTQQNWITASQYYTRHVNGDYGNVKGFEVDLFRQFTRFFGGNINYTYSIAKGKSSSAMSNYRFTWASLVIPKEENYLDWDQRHTINASLKMLIPYIGINVNTTMQYGSGLPYSPPNRSQLPEINTKRRPSTFNVDLYADKKFKFELGNKETIVSLFIWADNLFDNNNIAGIYDEEWYDLYSNYQKEYEAGNTTFFAAENDNNGIDDDGDGYIDDSLEDEYMMIMDSDGDGKIDENKQFPAGGLFSIPGYYNEGFRFKIGLSFKF